MTTKKPHWNDITPLKLLYLVTGLIVLAKIISPFLP